VTVPDIAHRYRMQNVLGSGAQATVYQALQKKTNRKTAVKVRHLASRSLARAGFPTCAALRALPSAPPQVLDQKELEDDDLFDALRMEIMILKQLKHPCATHSRCVPHPERQRVMRVTRARLPRRPTERRVRAAALLAATSST
jgi:serine/threonine protein kinase